MQRDLSVFLDLTRTLAAFTVFLGHVSSRFGGAMSAGLEAQGHSAVVVFFVLSGFVISWAAQRNGSAREYILNRAARIYSVALPALALTWIIDVFLILHYPGVINSTYQYDAVWKYLPIFLSFSTDFWFLSENAFSNVPYWSLCYEVWYYVVFGALLFSRPPWNRIIAITALLLMGPRLWLLWPIWLAGAYLHHLAPLSRNGSRMLLLILLLLLITLKVIGIETMLNDLVDQVTGGFAKTHLRYSQYFLGDYLVAAVVAAVIHAARGADLALLMHLRRPIAAVASISFSMYLIHYPLLLLFGVLFPTQAVLSGLLTLGCIIIFGLVFERNKEVFRRAFSAVWSLKNFAPTFR
jgi:peptidoglycan/LPS O-acetylase OafA/YrhL